MTTATDKEEWHKVTTPDGRTVWLGWGIEKNQTLMRERGVSFEQVVVAVMEYGIEGLYQSASRPDQ